MPKNPHRPEIRSHDPIIQSHRDAPTFNRLWLTNEVRLTTTQRTGFLLFSVVILLGGLMFVQGGMADLADGDLIGIIFLALATPALILGGWGLWRIAMDLVPSK
jgi:hypothetical protein